MLLQQIGAGLMELKNICKSFDGRQVLSDVSLVVPKGSRVLISGVSGRGKTTLLRIMMGLEKPDSGEITGAFSKQAAVFQEDRLQAEFTPVTCVKMTSGAHVTKQEIRARLSEVGLEGHMDKPAGKLSGGMRRRVAIVRALMSDADIIYFDEPFTGLDAETKLRVIECINRHTSGKTLVFVSHAEEDAALLNAKEIRI